VRAVLVERGVELPPQEGPGHPGAETAPPSEGPDAQLVAVASYLTELDAELARLRLEGEGIESALLNAVMGGSAGMVEFMEPVRLMVRREDAERAAHILHGEQKLPLARIPPHR